MRKFEFYVYILRCSDNSYYIGVTNNLDKRLSEHKNTSHTKSYLYKRRPFKLVLVEEINDIRLAISREKQIKGWSRNKKEALIKQKWDHLHELASCNNSTNWQRSVSPFDSAQDDTTTSEPIH